MGKGKREVEFFGTKYWLTKYSTWELYNYKLYKFYGSTNEIGKFKPITLLAKNNKLICKGWKAKEKFDKIYKIHEKINFNFDCNIPITKNKKTLAQKLWKYFYQLDLNFKEFENYINLKNNKLKLETVKKLFGNKKGFKRMCFLTNVETDRFVRIKDIKIGETYYFNRWFPNSTAGYYNKKVRVI